MFGTDSQSEPANLSEVLNTNKYKSFKLCKIFCNYVLDLASFQTCTTFTAINGEWLQSQKKVILASKRMQMHHKSIIRVVPYNLCILFKDFFKSCNTFVLELKFKLLFTDNLPLLWAVNSCDQIESVSKTQEQIQSDLWTESADSLKKDKCSDLVHLHPLWILQRSNTIRLFVCQLDTVVSDFVSYRSGMDG